MTSLEATAIRYTQCSHMPVAVIRSKGDTIDYAFMSDALRDFPGLTWVKKNMPVPAGTCTASFVGDTSRIRHGGRVIESSDMEDWFSGCAQKIDEEVVGLGRYGKVLTVLTGMQHPDENEADDAKLVASWTTKFSG